MPEHETVIVPKSLRDNEVSTGSDAGPESEGLGVQGLNNSFFQIVPIVHVCSCSFRSEKNF